MKQQQKMEPSKGGGKWSKTTITHVKQQQKLEIWKLGLSGVKQQKTSKTTKLKT